MEAPQRVFLIDAYAIIYRAYYAFAKNPRVNSRGFNTSAIFGFVNSLEELLRIEQPEYIAVVFDPPGKTFRHEAFEDYKAQRQKTPEDIKKAIPYIKQIIDAYGIKMFQVDRYEADDVVGTLAQKAQKLGFDVFMVTPDKDFAQLVSPNIFQYKQKYGASGFDVVGVEQVKKRYELATPIRMIDLLGLMGDASDNIPGCPGVGEKTAIKLLKDFGSIENLIDNTNLLKGSLKQKVEENIEQIKFSKFLATIKTDVPVDFFPEEVKRKSVDLEKATEIFTELEFRSFLNRFEQKNKKQTDTKQHLAVQRGLFDELPSDSQSKEHQDVRTPTPSVETIDNTPHEYILVDSDQQIHALISALQNQSEFCFDTETTSLDIHNSQLVGIAFCFEPHRAYFVPIGEAQEEAKLCLARFKRIFENPNTTKIGQNIKFDIQILKNYGIEVKGKIFDTMVAHYLLHPELRHNMDYLSETLLGYKPISYKELF